MPRIKICGIYKITSPSNKVYVGSSKDIHKRWVHYKNILCPKQTKLFHSLKKYGAENHKFEIIEECSLELLLSRERYWGEKLRTITEGLNLVLPEYGDKPRIVSLETRQRLSKIRKGRVSNRKGSKLTEEQKMKLRGRPSSFLGKKHSEESKQKMRISSTGFRHSEESKMKMSNLRKGRKGTPHTEATKQYFSNLYTGRKLSEEVKQKIKERATRNRLVLDSSMGIFYSNVREACEALNINYNTGRNYLDGHKKNKTNLIYA